MFKQNTCSDKKAWYMLIFKLSEYKFHFALLYCPQIIACLFVNLSMALFCHSHRPRAKGVVKDM